jgi:hypothetical protein
VKAAVNTETGEHVAIKVIEKEKIQAQELHYQIKKGEATLCHALWPACTPAHACLPACHGVHAGPIIPPTTNQSLVVGLTHVIFPLQLLAETPIFFPSHLFFTLS